MRPFHIAFCLVPEFGLTPIAVAIDVLRIANRVSSRQTFQWTVLSIDGLPVRSSCGLSLSVDGPIPAATRQRLHAIEPDVVFCVAAFQPEKYCYPALLRWLREQRYRGAGIGGISSGTYVLAAAGLLRGKSCTIHFEHQPLLTEHFSEVNVLPQLCVIDDNIYTCGGSATVFDLMLHLIEKQTNSSTASKVAEQLVLSRIRELNEPYRLPLGAQSKNVNSVTTRAVEVMDRNASEVLPIDAIATEIGISQRQLERVFKRELGSSPNHYYRKLRIERASALLRETNLSVTEIAIACGFRFVPSWWRRPSVVQSLHSRRRPMIR